MLKDSKYGCAGCDSIPEWVSCVNIPNVVQLAQSKMADAIALSSDDEQNQRDPILAAIEKGVFDRNMHYLLC